jgi:hypothetical protein
MEEFGHWLVQEYHWLYLVMALVSVWFFLLNPVVDVFLNHRRRMKELELKIQKSREAEARERNRNSGLHFD